MTQAALEAVLAAASVSARSSRSGLTWNWRQCARTQLTPTTTRALFIVDVLGPEALATATVAADDLERRLHAIDPRVGTARRVIAAPNA